MSVQAIHALEQSASQLGLERHPRQHVVLYAMAFKADEHGILIESHGGLAKRLGLTREAVRGAVRVLKRTGVLEAVANEHGGPAGTGVWYRLRLPGLSGDPADTIERVIAAGHKVPDGVGGQPPLRGDGGGDQPPRGWSVNGDGGGDEPLSTSTYPLENPLDNDPLGEEEPSSSIVDDGRPTQGQPNDGPGREEGKAEPPAVPAAVNGDQPAAPTDRQLAYLSGWCQAHGIDEELHFESRQDASAVIEAMEQAEGSRKAERMVERMVRQRLGVTGT